MGGCLRREASPVPYEKLQRRAKDTLDRIVQALKDAIPQSSVSEPERMSRLFFVSGEPGSGKSTLYETLKAMLGRSTGTEPKIDETYSAGYNPEELKLLRGRLGGVRWLEPIDLEVAGDEGENLLAAVLVRINDQLDQSKTVLSKDCEEAIQGLEELENEIGIAWDGNLRARAGALDPDMYSLEVMRTQRARLRVNGRLKDAINTLAQRRCCDCSENTLFVLPVDDFYLKPHASLQLLRLLRMISVPRLFFLVMGDITTVEALFIEKSIADWTAVAGVELFASDPERLSQASMRARELRARYLRKLLPPGQRATIQVMDWDEALDFDVDGWDGANRDRTLKALLSEVLLDGQHRDPSVPPAATQRGKKKPPLTSPQTNTLETLLDLLVCPRLSGAEDARRKLISKDRKERKSIDEQRKEKDRAAYTVLQILDATPREVLDFGNALLEVRRRREAIPADDDTPVLLSSVMELTKLATEEQNFLSAIKQKTLEGVLPTRHYSQEDMHFKMDVLSLTPDSWPWEKPVKGLKFRKHRSWNLRVKGGPESGADQSQEPGESNGVIDPFDKLPPRPLAWIALLHDLAWRWKKDSITGNLIEGLRDRLEHQHKDGQLERPEGLLGWAVLEVSEEKRLAYKHFPMPKEFGTFDECDRFLRVWNICLERREFLKGLKEPHSASDGSVADAVDIPRRTKEAYIDFWGLAGAIVLRKQYEEFSCKGDKWLKEQLRTWRADKLLKVWRSRIEDFEKQIPEQTSPAAPEPTSL